MNTLPVLYRYEDSIELRSFGLEELFSTRDYVIRLKVFPAIKQTRCGYWIRYLGKNKFINTKREHSFAYPTIQEARSSYLTRKRSQVQILAAKLEAAKEYFSLAQQGMFRD